MVNFSKLQRFLFISADTTRKKPNKKRRKNPLDLEVVTSRNDAKNEAFLLSTICLPQDRIELHKPLAVFVPF